MRKNIILKAIIGILIFFIIFNLNKIKFLFSFLNIYANNLVVKRDLDSFDSINRNPLIDFLKQEEINKSLDPSHIIPENDSPLDKNNEDENSENLHPNKSIQRKAKPSLDKKEISSIAITYNEKFESLQNEFMNSLNGLVESGFNEYQSGKTAKSELASKYLDLGSDLENKSDKIFFATLEEMRVELKENGHNTDITKEIANYYKTFKELEKNKLLSKLEE